MRPNLATLVQDFRRFGPQTAIVHYTGVRRHATSYGELAQRAGRFAALLEERNIAEGDRVLLWAANSPDWLAAFYGCVLRGVIAVPLDAYGSAEFAQRVAEDVKPSLITGDAALLAQLPAKYPRIAFEEFSARLPNREAAAADNLTAETPLQIIFTSGTTGSPKGVVHSHGNVLASLTPIETEIKKYIRLERPFHPLRFLHTLPLSHVFGQFMGLWIPPLLAAEVHLEDQLVASQIIDRIRRERISVLAAVPRVLSLLQTHLESENPELAQRLGAAEGSSAWARWVRFRDIHHIFGYKFWTLVSGGGALPPSVERFWNGLGFVLVQGYGMTETTALITLNHPFHVARGTIGRPLPGRDVKISPDGEVLVRGPMISNSTWQQGGIHTQESPWLATGDIAEAAPTGELRFLGRKSEVIVTSAGINIHPEDLEAALLDASVPGQVGVTAAAVVPFTTRAGTEPFAVLAFRGSHSDAEAVVAAANARLADFQRIRRFALWPAPDLPRTASGKVRRREVSAWLAKNSGAQQTGATATPELSTDRPRSQSAEPDWLMATIAQITGEAVPVAANFDALRLEEDLHLDSLGRVQLATVLEQSYGTAGDANQFAEVRTVGQLRAWLGLASTAQDSETSPESASTRIAAPSSSAVSEREISGSTPAAPQRSRFLYPRWPWTWPVRWLRILFIELVMRPLVWMLAAPRISGAPAPAASTQPMLLIANHITAYDVPLLLYALPRWMRWRTAVAMSGEMLEDFRHARNQPQAWLNPLGPVAWLLITALFNVFPLPRQRDIQRSFAHIGRALDSGLNVLIFPEGARSRDATLHGFRPGIGLLAQQAEAPILPLALAGFGDLVARRRRWLHAGNITIRVGEPVTFTAGESPQQITSELHGAVEKLLG
jgi:long-chain acyl-CoA synthetase